MPPGRAKEGVPVLLWYLTIQVPPCCLTLGHRAMAFLRECELLKIEDVLPFFPDFVLIDDFKVRGCRVPDRR